jgi:glycosyltransferase involved in cell wall biosynthesis
MFSSIMHQSRKPDQVVFIDDCSPDRTGELLDNLVHSMDHAGATDYRIITNATNLGQSASLNRAISEATTDLVMVLNDDDYLMDIFLIGSHSIHFSRDEELAAGVKLVKALAPAGGIPLVRQYPEDVAGYRKFNDLNMTHSGSCFLKAAWQAVGGYIPEKEKRLVPFSDRDFQLRINSLFPVAVSYEIPFVYWRSNSSIDNGIDS